MTQMFPDVSSYQRGLRLQPGTVAVIAKATQGTHYQDDTFHDFVEQAGTIGAIASGYHFIEQGNGAAQADYCHAFAGAVPMMIDCEPVDGSRPRVDDCLDFIRRYTTLGGRVWGVYLPRWYWGQIGGDLHPLQDAGACLVSSDYSGYSDSPTAAGWQPYGGLVPTVWQSTNHGAYGGKMVDFNAFRGTLDDLKNLIQGDDMTPHDVWGFKGNNGDGLGPDAPDVHQTLLTTRDNSQTVMEAFAKQTPTIEQLAETVARIAAKVGA